MPASADGNTTNAFRPGRSPVAGEGRCTRHPPRKILAWQYDGLRFLTHIVVDPPPSRLRAIHAPSRSSSSAKAGSRTPLD